METEDRQDRPGKHDSVASKTEETKKTKTPQQQANELREKLLKEKIIKMRRTSNSSPVNS
ncbi:putative PWI domain-containing protein [Seiridium cardinale]